MTWRNHIFAIECKVSLSPVLSRGNYNAFEDINPKKTFVVIPNGAGYALTKNIDVVPLKDLFAKIKWLA